MGQALGSHVTVFEYVHVAGVDDTLGPEWFGRSKSGSLEQIVTAFFCWNSV